MTESNQNLIYFHFGPKENIYFGPLWKRSIGNKLNIEPQEPFCCSQYYKIIKLNKNEHWKRQNTIFINDLFVRFILLQRSSLAESPNQTQRMFLREVPIFCSSLLQPRNRVPLIGSTCLQGDPTSKPRKGGLLLLLEPVLELVWTNLSQLMNKF